MLLLRVPRPKRTSYLVQAPGSSTAVLQELQGQLRDLRGSISAHLVSPQPPAPALDEFERQAKAHSIVCATIRLCYAMHMLGSHTRTDIKDVLSQLTNESLPRECRALLMEEMRQLHARRAEAERILAAMTAPKP